MTIGKKIRANHFIAPTKYKKIFHEMTKISKNIYNCCIYSHNVLTIFKNDIYKFYYEIVQLIMEMLKDNYKDYLIKNGNDIFAEIFKIYHDFYTENKSLIKKNNEIIYKHIKNRDIILTTLNIEEYKTNIINELQNKIEYNDSNKKIVFTDIIEKIIKSKYHRQFITTKDELLSHKKLTYNNDVLINEVKANKYYYETFSKVNEYIEKIEKLLNITRNKENNEEKNDDNKLFKSQQYYFKYSVYNNFLGDNKDKLPSDITANIIDKYYTSIKSYYALLDKKIKANKPKYIENNFNLFYYPSSFKLMKNKVRLTVGKHISNNLPKMTSKNLYKIDNINYCLNSNILNKRPNNKNYKVLKEKKYVNKNNIINGTYVYIKLSTKFKKLIKKNKNHTIKLVEIKPFGNNYYIHVSYEIDHNENKEIKTLKPTIENSVSIDTGIKNLLTIYNPTGSQHIIRGNKLVSINEFYNKKIGELQSINKRYFNKNTFNRLYSLNKERTNKIDGEIDRIINILVKKYNDKTIFIVGKNDNWKTNVNLGKNTNRKFYKIPYCKILLKLKNKLELLNKKLITIEESYTSLCCSLSLEKLCRKEKYNGTRKMRGLYISQNNKAINADLNGAINIMRKIIPLTEIKGKNIYNPTIL
jgi:putative transposase